jgi:hypothetical protein
MSQTRHRGCGAAGGKNRLLHKVGVAQAIFTNVPPD